tara:strand:+ start:383 stop:904 length:522 start_codon:yes stop_codon:yes gene_type:complete
MKDKNKKDDTSYDGLEKPKMPSIFKMAANFAKDLTKYIADGAPNVTHEQYVKRLETCNACPNLIKESMRCNLCGCLMEHKAKWRTAKCPAKPERWDPVYLSPSDLIKMESAQKEYKKEELTKEVDDKAGSYKRAQAMNKLLKANFKDGKFNPEIQKLFDGSNKENKDGGSSTG